MEKISAIIITLNEERNIERCLKSLQGIADEIIVVDSFSTDRTEEICKIYNATFVQQKWLGYAEQKNFANSLAQNDNILSLDADEALSEDLRNSIHELKQQPILAVYSVSRLTNYCGKWIRYCGWYPDKKIRIFNKQSARWKNLKVHEEIELLNQIPVIHLKGDLFHYSYYSITEHISQANKYSTLAAEEYYEKNKKCSLFALLLKTIWRFKRDYFFKLGFLDGFYGFVICNISAITTFLKYTKLRQLHKANL